MSPTATELLSTASSHLAMWLSLQKNKCSWDKTLRDCEFSNDIAGWQGGWQAKVCRIYTARSTVYITDCKGMDLCPIRAFFKEKPSSFDIPAPKLNSSYQATSSRQKVAHSLYRSAILKKSSDRTHRIVHVPPCCTFHASLCTI